MRTIFIVKCNADMVEGRGAMVFHSAWDNKEQAVEFMDAQKGVGGRAGPWSTKERGDWTIDEALVYASVADYYSTADEDRRYFGLLHRLSDADRELLRRRGV